MRFAKTSIISIALGIASVLTASANTWWVDEPGGAMAAGAVIAKG